MPRPARLMLVAATFLAPMTITAARAQDFLYPGSDAYSGEWDNRGYSCPPGSVPSQGYDGSLSCMVPTYPNYGYPSYGYAPQPPRRIWDNPPGARLPPPGGFTPGLGAAAQAQQEELRRQQERQQWTHGSRQAPQAVPEQQLRQQYQQQQLHPLPPGGWRP